MKPFMYFETDEAAEEMANALGAPLDALDECGGLEIHVNNVRFTIDLDLGTGMWALHSPLDVCNSIRVLYQAYHDVPAIQTLREAQRIMKTEGLFETATS